MRCCVIVSNSSLQASHGNDSLLSALLSLITSATPRLLKDQGLIFGYQDLPGTVNGLHESHQNEVATWVVQKERRGRTVRRRGGGQGLRRGVQGAPRRAGGKRGGLIGPGQQHGEVEGGPLPQGALHPDGAAHQLAQPLADRQAQPWRHSQNRLSMHVAYFDKHTGCKFLTSYCPSSQ